MNNANRTSKGDSTESYQRQRPHVSWRKTSVNSPQGAFFINEKLTSFKKELHGALKERKAEWFTILTAEQPSKARRHRPWCPPSPGTSPCQTLAGSVSPTRTPVQLFNTETKNLIKQSNSKTKGKHVSSQWKATYQPKGFGSLLPSKKGETISSET